MNLLMNSIINHDFIFYVVDQDEYVRKNVATLIREIAKHTPEVGHNISLNTHSFV